MKHFDSVVAAKTTLDVCGQKLQVGTWETADAIIKWIYGKWDLSTLIDYFHAVGKSGGTELVLKLAALCGVLDS